MIINGSLRALVPFILGGLLLSSCSTTSSANRKKAELYFGAGTQNLVAQDYTEALKNFLEANRLDPKNADILNNLGMAYYFKGEKDLAVNTLKEALKINKNNSDARNNLASIYYQDKNYTDAEELYKKVLTDLTYDKLARTLFNLGTLELEVKKNPIAAEKYFKKSLDEDDNYCPSHYQLGLIQYNRRQLNSALKYFKNATLGTCFELPAPHYYQALTLTELKRYDEARAKLEEIDARFKQSIYAVKARSKAIELKDIETTKTTDSQASRMMLESPDF
jgi:type IV pilus assembly protein PilF